MRFTELHFRNGRSYAKGDFMIVQVNGTALFVGEQDEPGVGAVDPRPQSKRIAVPVGAIEWAVPADEPDGADGIRSRAEQVDAGLRPAGAAAYDTAHEIEDLVRLKFGRMWRMRRA